MLYRSVMETQLALILTPIITIIFIQIATILSPILTIIGTKPCLSSHMSS